MLLERIVEGLSPTSEGLIIADIRIGLEYVALELSNGAIGVSYLIKEGAGGRCVREFGEGGYLGTSAAEAIRWSLHMKDTLLSSVGVAALNALTVPVERPEGGGKNGIEHLGISSSDVVGMIGNFKPMVPALEKRCKELRIFERKETDDPNIYPDWAAYSLLPSCDVVIISGTTNINKTQEILLSCCTGAREVEILGPSTIMYPEAYAGTTATMLAGAYADPALKNELFSVVCQGGGGSQLLRYLRKYSIRLG